MNYGSLFAAIGYTALKLGLLVEMLALRILGDIAGAVHRGCVRLYDSGQRQLAMLPNAALPGSVE